MKNQEKALLKILKSPSGEYNANQLSKFLGMSSMGALKLLRRMESEGVLKSRKISNIVLFSLGEGDYAEEYVSVLLKKEAGESGVKRWVGEIKGVKSAKVGILFGSVLSKGNNAGDIDVLFVVERKNFSKLRKEVEKINEIGDKQIDAVYQTREDLIENIKKGDRVVLEAIEGVIAFGERDFVKLLGEIK